MVDYDSVADSFWPSLDGMTLYSALMFTQSRTRRDPRVGMRVCESRIFERFPNGAFEAKVAHGEKDSLVELMI